MAGLRPLGWGDAVGFNVDFNLRRGDAGYEVHVQSSTGGEATGPVAIDLDDLRLRNQLQALEITVLRGAGGHRAIGDSDPALAEDLGTQLYGALFPPDVRAVYEVAREKAAQQGEALRVRLRFHARELAALPWELVRKDDQYLALSKKSPVVRYIDMPDAPTPTKVVGALRVLALVASPSDLAPLDVDRERQQLIEALAPLREKGSVELQFVDPPTWRGLQRALRKGPWHVFHFVGHGAFLASEQGVLAFEDDAGGSRQLKAEEVGMLLGAPDPLRLAVLNCCDAGKSGPEDRFSGVAETLVRTGTPAVVAMQTAITDAAAVELSRTFYEALADGTPIDIALTEARNAIYFDFPGTLEWATPVLHLRAPDGRLFDVDEESRTALPPAPAGPRPEPWWRRHARELVVGGAGAIAVAIGAAVLWPDPDPPVRRRLTLLPVRNAIEVAADGDDAWVTTTNGAVVHIRDGIPRAPVQLDDEPVSNIVFAEQRLFVVAHGGQRVVELDPSTLGVIAEDRFAAHRPNDLAVDAGSIWVSAGRDVIRVDRETRQQLVTPDVCAGDCADIDIDHDGYAWVADQSGRVVVLNPAGRMVRPIELGGRPIAVLTGRIATFVTISRGDEAGQVARVTRDGELLFVDVGSAPWGLALGDGAVWVAHRGDRSIRRVALQDGALGAQIAGCADDAVDGIDVTGSELWVVTSPERDVAAVQRLRLDGLEAGAARGDVSC